MTGRRSLHRTVLAFSMLWSGTTCSNPSAPNANITGTVFVDGVPAANVTVEIDRGDGPEQSAVTDANGMYSIPLASGVVTVLVREFSGATEELECLNGSTEIEIRSGETKTANFNCLDKRPYDATITGGYNHTIPGVESVECKLIVTNPRRPGATYQVTVDGPMGNQPPSGVIPGQGLSGTLDAQGTARVSIRINRTGVYRNIITITSLGGVVKTYQLDVPVTGAPSTCPFGGASGTLDR
jgi:hypothetical protein